MKTIAVEDAIGLILCQDITEIIPGERKGVAFRKGHVVSGADIPLLKNLGKEHLYVWSTDSTDVHENDAARRIAKAISGAGLEYGEPEEGRINIIAKTQGLLTVDTPLLDRLNSIEHVTIATIHGVQEVRPGRMVAGTRVIPIAVPESTMQAVEECCAQGSPLLRVVPFKKHKVGIVTTGREVYSGRIKDAFGPVLHEKMGSWGSEVHSQELVPDETSIIVEAIMRALDKGATLVTVTGGMSVDPDDKTPAAIRAVGCDVITYGSPVFPGAMFMLAYKGDIPVLGLPGCVMYERASVFDLIMPRILAGMRITPHDITSFAHGGLCEKCSQCHYPHCSFGKQAS